VRKPVILLRNSQKEKEMGGRSFISEARWYAGALGDKNIDSKGNVPEACEQKGVFLKDSKISREIPDCSKEGDGKKGTHSLRLLEGSTEG